MMPTLRSLSHLNLLRLTCGGCGRVRDIPSRFMAMMCGEETEILTMPRRIRCHVCGYRGISSVDILSGQVDLQGSYFIYQEDDGMRRLF